MTGDLVTGELYELLEYCSTVVESNRLCKSVSLMCMSCCQPFVVNLQNVLPASTRVETNCGSVNMKERPEMRGSCYNGETRYSSRWSCQTLWDLFVCWLVVELLVLVEN